RQHLAELDEDRPQRFQRQAQTLAARLADPAPEQDASHQRLQRPQPRVTEQQVVEPEAQQDEDDAGEPENAHQSESPFTECVATVSDEASLASSFSMRFARRSASSRSVSTSPTNCCTWRFLAS